MVMPLNLLDTLSFELLMLCLPERNSTFLKYIFCKFQRPSNRFLPSLPHAIHRTYIFTLVLVSTRISTFMSCEYQSLRQTEIQFHHAEKIPIFLQGYIQPRSQGLSSSRGEILGTREGMPRIEN